MDKAFNFGHGIRHCLSHTHSHRVRIVRKVYTTFRAARLLPVKEVSFGFEGDEGR